MAGSAEFESFSLAVEPFTKETGIGMAFEISRELSTLLVTRVEAGNPPDLAILPNSGILVEFAEGGDLVPLDTFIDMGQLKQDYAQAWIDLASVDGKLYGVGIKGDALVMFFSLQRYFVQGILAGSVKG